MKSQESFRSYIVLIQVIILCIFLFSFFYQWRHERMYILESARIVADSRFQKDVELRAWVTFHGGVYVPVTEETPINPFIKGVEEREITTPSGRTLTLLNPAYIIRQLYKFNNSESSNYISHITSLNPINSLNEADEWETSALIQMERDSSEVISIEKMDGERFYRLMKPFYAEESCMKCHEQQGYSIGQLRGGISISFTYEPYQKIINKSALILFFWHALAIILVNTTIYFAKLRIDKALKMRDLSLTSLKIKELELNEALNIAERSEKLKSIFLANMSHEIRTPLNAIIGFSELMEDVDSEKQIKEYSQIIQRNGNNLLNIISDILDISIIEAGKIKINVEEVNLNKFFETLYYEYDKLIQNKKLTNYTLKLQIPNDNLVIYSDPAKLWQIMANLVINALKYAQYGVISIGFERILENRVKIFVKDTGVGIETNRIDNIFQMFNRHDPLNKSSEGAGLGLNLVKSIGEALGGTVIAESSPGQGSNFSIILPIEA